MHNQFDDPLNTPSPVEIEPPDLSSLLDKNLACLAHTVYGWY